MKKIAFLFLSSFVCSLAFAQQDNKITIGVIDSVQSKILNENRKVWVYVPYSKNDGVQQRYPVIYLLDGNSFFSTVVALVQQFSETDWNWVLPKMIVVGIPSTNRRRDLTPYHVEADPPFFDKEGGKPTGGGRNFVYFMQNELMPHIDSLYPTQPYKILIGHSFGGLTAVNILTNYTKLFNAYIAIDPSMWWDNLHFLEATKKLLTQGDFSGRSLYIGIANTLREDMDTSKIRKDTAYAWSRHIRANLDLNDFLKSQTPKGLRYNSRYYENDDHMSVPFITEYDGLRFIFKNYQVRFSGKESDDSTFNYAGTIKHHYAEISKMLGYDMMPPEDMINDYGHSFIGEKQFTKAWQLLQMNIENYPEGYKVYDACGDYFIAVGDKVKAAAYLKKALSLKENPESRKKLNELAK